MRRLLVWLALISPAAYANDGASVMGSGGVELKSNDAVAMEYEDLYVSKDLVRVKYRFRNTTTKTVKTLIAFPVEPGCGPEMEEGKMATAWLPVDFDVKNPLKFELKVDGKTKPFDVEVKDGKGKPDSGGMPTRCKTITYHWEQEFPAGKVVTLEQQYVPAAGYGPDFPAKADAETTRRYCIDKHVAKALKKKGDDNPYSELRYILTTAKTWKGPIGEFHLTIDKGSKEKTVSLCRKGLKKISPTTFQWSAKNYVPDGELDVLFVD